MVDIDKAIETFCAESKSGNSVWVVYSEGRSLELEDINELVTPLWSSLRRCQNYISNINSENEIRPVEIPMDTFVAVWITTASSNNSVFCLNADKDDTDYVVLKPAEIKDLLRQ